MIYRVQASSGFCNEKVKNSMVLAAHPPHFKKGLQKSEQGSPGCSFSAGTSDSSPQQWLLQLELSVFSSFLKSASAGCTDKTSTIKAKMPAIIFIGQI